MASGILAHEGADQGLWRCSGKEASPSLQGIENLRPLSHPLSPGAESAPCGELSPEQDSRELVGGSRGGQAADCRPGCHAWVDRHLPGGGPFHGGKRLPLKTDPLAPGVGERNRPRQSPGPRGGARSGVLPAVIAPSEAPTETAAAGAPSISWKAEEYCKSQILVSGGEAKVLGSIYHAMVAWACSNPEVLNNGRAIADFISRQASPHAFDPEALRVSIKANPIEGSDRRASGGGAL
jgi:hypothetical protein